jgi:hypothetical protein
MRRGNKTVNKSSAMKTAGAVAPARPSRPLHEGLRVHAPSSFSSWWRPRRGSGKPPGGPSPSRVAGPIRRKNGLSSLFDDCKVTLAAFSGGKRDSPTRFRPCTEAPSRAQSLPSSAIVLTVTADGGSGRGCRSIRLAT